MSAFCTRCGSLLRETFLSGAKTCSCVAYRIWREEDGDDGEAHAATVYAHTPCGAAETWAERDDIASAEYAIAGKGQSVVVCIEPVAGGPIERWRVTGEILPSYYAEKA